ncbi:hypothetical protein BpHYR1_026278 [Brachionus plicatilis]|uniref:Uncharacterized protein n=1 Tax=Brachionus plicatilis TaxID=10195 RepID=A0A3M7QWZ7_BRAPC|nr:hypothetical protein BpHYR1_026278 [Brachionus plicatilis]
MASGRSLVRLICIGIVRRYGPSRWTVFKNGLTIRLGLILYLFEKQFKTFYVKVVNHQKGFFNQQVIKFGKEEIKFHQKNLTIKGKQQKTFKYIFGISRHLIEFAAFFLASLKLDKFTVFNGAIVGLILSTIASVYLGLVGVLYNKPSGIKPVSTAGCQNLTTTTPTTNLLYSPKENDNGLLVEKMKWIQIKPIKPEFLFDLSIWNNKKIGQNRVDFLF